MKRWEKLTDTFLIEFDSRVEFVGSTDAPVECIFHAIDVTRRVSAESSLINLSRV